MPASVSALVSSTTLALVACRSSSHNLVSDMGPVGAGTLRSRNWACGCRDGEGPPVRYARQGQEAQFEMVRLEHRGRIDQRPLVAGACITVRRVIICRAVVSNRV